MNKWTIGIIRNKETVDKIGNIIYSIGQLHRGRRVYKVTELKRVTGTKQSGGGVYPRPVFTYPLSIAKPDRRL